MDLGRSIGRRHVPTSDVRQAHRALPFLRSYPAAVSCTISYPAGVLSVVHLPLNAFHGSRSRKREREGEIVDKN
jgi:hypothetical protein